MLYMEKLIIWSFLFLLRTIDSDLAVQFLFYLASTFNFSLIFQNLKPFKPYLQDKKVGNDCVGEEPFQDYGNISRYYLKNKIFNSRSCKRREILFQKSESTSTASQLTSSASQKIKDLNKVSLLLQDLDSRRSFSHV